MKSGKGKGMGYHGGKARVGKSGIKHATHFDSPDEAQTRTESSKNMGIHYMPDGTMDGKLARGRK